MNAFKEARKLIEGNPLTETAQTLSDLVIALESQQAYRLERLYALELRHFELAIALISEWRLDRYYARKGKLLDLSVEVRALLESGTPNTKK